MSEKNNKPGNFGNLYNDLNNLVNEHGEAHTLIMLAANLFARSLEEEKRKTEEVQAWVEQSNRDYMEIVKLEQLKIQQQLRNNNH